MKGFENWQQLPRTLYREFFIAQILPKADGFSVDFRDFASDGAHTLCYRERGNEEWLTSESLNVSGLKTETDYEIAIRRADGVMCDTRLVRTFEPIGTVVNYLHPDDTAYISSGMCSTVHISFEDIIKVPSSFCSTG